MAEPRSTVGLVARPEILERLALQAEHNPTRLGRAGAAIVRDAEIYLQFYAELGTRPERTEFRAVDGSWTGPRCERCGTATPWPVVNCAACKGLA